MKTKLGAETVWIAWTVGDLDIDIFIAAPNRLKNCLKADFAKVGPFWQCGALVDL
jgi:hypothetical protein